MNEEGIEEEDEPEERGCQKLFWFPPLATIGDIPDAYTSSSLQNAIP